MNRLVMIVLLLALPAAACAHAQHRRYQAAATILLVSVIGCATSQQIASPGRSWITPIPAENPIMGTHPTAAGSIELGVTSAAVAVGVAMLPDRYVPDALKSMLLSGLVAGEAGTVYLNQRADRRPAYWCGQ